VKACPDGPGQMPWPPSWVLFVVTVLSWGTSWYAIRFQLGEVHPALSVAYRFALASSLMLIFCLGTGRRLRFPASHHVGIALQGLLLFCLNYILLYYATFHLTTGLVAVIFATIQFMNIINGRLLFATPLSAPVLAGGLCGLVGIVLVFWPQVQALESSPGVLKGIGLSVLGTWFASLGNMASVFNQRRGLPVLQTNAIGMAYGALFMAAGAFMAGAPLAFEWSYSYVLSMLYLALFASVLAFGAYLTLLGREGANRAAYAMVVFPVVALLISTVSEGYRWHLSAVAGIVLIALGNRLVFARPSDKGGEHSGPEKPG